MVGKSACEAQYEEERALSARLRVLRATSFEPSWWSGNEVITFGIRGLLIFSCVVGIGLLLWFLPPSRVEFLTRAAPSIDRNWHRLFAIYFLGIAISGIVISQATHQLRHLFEIEDRAGEHQRKADSDQQDLKPVPWLLAGTLPAAPTSSHL